MVVSIVLIHALAKRLGLKIYYSTLVATAIVSFMIIFAAVILSPALDKKFFLYLGGLILATSFLLTLINNFLIRKQRDEERIFTEQVKAAYAEEIKKDSAKPVVEEIVDPIDKFEWGNENPQPEKNTELETTEEVVEPVKKEKPLEEFPLENVFKPLNEVKAEAVAKAMQDKSPVPFEEPKPEENFPLQAVFNPLDEVKSEVTKKSLQDKSAVPFEEPKPEENFPLQETFRALDEVKPDMLKKIQPEVKPLDLPEKLELIVEEKISEPPFELSTPVEKVQEPTSKPAPVEKVNEPTSKPAPVEKVLEPAVKSPKPEVKQNQNKKKASKANKKRSKPKPAQNAKKVTKPVVETPKPKKPDKKVSTPPVESAKTLEEKIPTPPVESAKTLEEKIPTPDIESLDEDNNDTLDNILDKAYDARANGYMWQAMAFYKKALERYNSDEYAPFVAIDLGNLYKENALYSKAIKTYEDALKLPSVKNNAETKNEFVKNLEYLRVVRDILLKHRAASTPFDKIPKEILQEIDAEFQKTQLHAV